MLLDPRRWTLLNGKDSASRDDITALLGLGDNALRVDNAASCVIACVNTPRRDIAFKRAAEVLAWREVLKQLTDDTEDELTEARAKHDEALTKLRRDIERAYQHYAYLVRAGDLHVEYKRFDEDSRTALNGGHVWTALIEAGRATQPGGLAAGYMGALLGDFDRADPARNRPLLLQEPGLPAGHLHRRDPPCAVPADHRRLGARGCRRRSARRGRPRADLDQLHQPDGATPGLQAGAFAGPDSRGR